MIGVISWMNFQNFLSNDEKWNKKLLQLREYFIANDKYPPRSSTDPDVKSLGEWRKIQQQNYKHEKKYMIVGAPIRDTWGDFIAEFPELFLSNDEKWNEKLLQLKEYVIVNDKFPSQTNSDPDVKSLGEWRNDQQQNYNKERYGMIVGAANRGVWSDFMDEYDHAAWKSRLAEVEKYFIANNKSPSRSDNNPDFQLLGRWLNTQQQQFKNEKQIMKNIIIRDIWINFKNKHEKYFPSNHRKSELEPQHDESEILTTQ
jgi:hypothetical protein